METKVGAASFGQLLAALSGRHKSGKGEGGGGGGVGAEEVRITGNNATANKES